MVKNGESKMKMEQEGETEGKFPSSRWKDGRNFRKLTWQINEAHFPVLFSFVYFQVSILYALC